MDASEKRKVLRTLIEAPEIAVMPGVFDGFSAKLSERMGFKGGLITGAGVSEARLGKPDVGIMGLEANLAASKALAEATDMALIGDADTGYGGPINVYHAVRDFETVGLAGVMIEDQVWPKRCGHLAGKEVISADEMVEKVRAAVDGRRDPNFVIRARTDAAGVIGLDEAIRRLNLYADAGADLLFADALLKKEDIELVARSVSKPLTVNMGFGIRTRGTTPLLSAKQLEDLGVATVDLPRMLTAAAIQGMKNAFEALSQSLDTGAVVDRPDLLVSFEELSDLMGLTEYREMEKRYLSPEKLEAMYGPDHPATGRAL